MLIKIKENLESSNRKTMHHLDETPVRLIAEVSGEIRDWQWLTYLVFKKKSQLRILYLEKLSLPSEGDMKVFPFKKYIYLFVASRPALL